MLTAPVVAPRLVVIQATSLCNLNCSYCYVPDRRNRDLLSDEMLRAIASFVFACDLPTGKVELLWHAGEPLAAGLPFYKHAFALLEQLTPPGVSLDHVMQTNGTLITPAWCSLFSEYHVSVGLSVDGPADIHNLSRRTWGGKGTHDRVMRGYHLLRESGVSPGVICVLTRESLKYPDRIYDFFKEAGFTNLGFNVEEAEGAHQRSDLGDVDTIDIGKAYKSFMCRIWDRWRADDSRIEIREFQQLLACIYGLKNDSTFVRTPDEVIPFKTITIGRDGAITTFSPELISTQSEYYGNFWLGNVLTDAPTDVARRLSSTRFYRDVTTGQEQCRATCPYYPLCGGGFFPNRFTEHGSLLATETLTCRLHRKILTDVVIDRLVAESSGKLSAEQSSTSVAVV
jgi:uncharacterized protein